MSQVPFSTQLSEKEAALYLGISLSTIRRWRHSRTGPLRETYEPLTVPKHGPGQALTPEQTAKLIETAKTNDRWFVALCATVLAYATGCRSGEIKQLRLGDLDLGAGGPYIRLRAENTKARRHREPALNDLGIWAVNQLLDRARLLGAADPRALFAAGGSLEAHQGNGSLKGGKGL
jgi:integrase